MKMQNVNTRTVALPIKNTAKFLTAFGPFDFMDALKNKIHDKLLLQEQRPQSMLPKMTNKDHSLCFLR